MAAGQTGARALRGLRASFDRTLQVVEGASLVSTAQMRDLLRVSTALHIACLVLVGDDRWAGGTPGSDRGRPFAQLLRAGMPAAVMTETDHRREAEWIEVVRAPFTDAVRRAFDKIGSAVSEVPLERLSVSVAALWLALPTAKRGTTELVALSLALRHEINEAVRRGHVLEGSISGPACECGRLTRRDLGRAALVDPSTHSPGDTVIFRRPYKGLGVCRGDERTVTAVDPEAKLVRLADVADSTREWKPGSLAALAGGVELHSNEPLELRVGDRVRWTRDDRSLGQSSSRPMRVEAVGGGQALFCLTDGTVSELAVADPRLRHLKHTRVSPPDAAQVGSAGHLITTVETSDPNLATKESLYGVLGAASGRAQLATDSAARLAKLLEAVTDERVEVLNAAAGQNSPA